MSHKESGTNETFQAEKEYELEANSFHFHFDKISQETPEEQNTHPKIGRTDNGIIYIVDEDITGDKDNFNCENTMANKSTSHSNILSLQNPKTTEFNESSNLVFQTQHATIESSFKVSTPKRDCETELKPKVAELITKSSIVSNEDLNLATRRDVVNKTVLRIMRRFFMNKFKEAFPEKFKGKESKSKWYFEYVKKLVIKLFGADHPELETMQAFMASIINPKHMTNINIKETGFEKEEFLTFYNTIYKYSHTRLTSLFEVQSYKEIYTYFYNGPMDQIIKSEASVSKNSTLYSKAFADFNNVFEGTADIHTLTTN